MLIAASGPLHPGFFLLTLGDSCHYALWNDFESDSPSCSIFDPGSSIHIEPLLRRLSAFSISPQSISNVFITHLHPERIAGLPLLRTLLPHLKVFGSARMQAKLNDSAFAKELFEADQYIRSLYPNLELRKDLSFDHFRQNLKIDRVFPESETFNLSEDVSIRCLALPGHTEETICYLVEPFNFLVPDECLGYFRGKDLVAPGGDYDLSLSVQSLAKLKDLDIGALCLPFKGVLSGDLVRRHIEATILNTFYPNHEWLPWKMATVPAGFWSVRKNRKKFFDYLGRQLEYAKPEDWYRLKVRDVQRFGGGGLLSHCYRDSIYEFIKDLGPRYSYKMWLFKRVPVNFWKKHKHRKDYMSWLAGELNITCKDDWYTVTAHDVRQNNGAGLLQRYYKNSPTKMIMSLVKRYRFDETLFIDALKGERSLLRTVEKLYGKANVRWHFRPGNMRFPASKRAMEFDVWVLRRKIAFEYHGSQHYVPYHRMGDEEGLKDIQRRDRAKAKMCMQKKVRLVVVPYFWDGTVSQLLRRIESQCGKGALP